VVWSWGRVRMVMEPFEVCAAKARCQPYTVRSPLTM
jgi:hypothetical protein